MADAEAADSAPEHVPGSRKRLRNQKAKQRRKLARHQAKEAGMAAETRDGEGGAAVERFPKRARVSEVVGEPTQVVGEPTQVVGVGELRVPTTDGKATVLLELGVAAAPCASAPSPSGDPPPLFSRASVQSEAEVPFEPAAASKQLPAEEPPSPSARGPRLPGRPPPIHGNYHRYYGYRLGSALEADPRLALLRRGWFARRDCLDVGCNEGVVPLALARAFGPRSMTGVDIDAALVKKACTALRRLRSEAQDRAMKSRTPGQAPDERRAAEAARAALARTRFVEGDVLESEAEAGSFDTVTCLSVVKWVHLNGGDEALDRLCRLFYRLLRPGGILVLEPQPWSSYQAAVRKLRRWREGASGGGGGAEGGATTTEAGDCADGAPPPAEQHRSLDSLSMRPETLVAHLCDEVGFRLVQTLWPGGEVAQGFGRPMHVLRKPHGTPAPALPAAALEPHQAGNRPQENGLA